MNVKLYVRIVIIVVLTISALPSLAQEKSKEPERLITETKTVAAKIKFSQSDMYEVRGEATYTIETIQPDDSFTGTLVYTLTEEARRKLAKLAGKSLADIPAKFEQKEVRADFEKKTECPSLHLEFETFEKLEKVKIKSGEIEILFGRFVLGLPETPQEVSKLVCRYVEAMNNGRVSAYRRYSRHINNLLKGEQ